MKVLLFANVGTDHNGFYHIGDEAMFHEIYKKYREESPQSQLTALVSLPLKKRPHLIEQRGLPWPDTHGKAAQRYFIKLILKSLFWRVTHKTLFSSEQQEIFDLVQAQDRIHFTGGGNLTSLFQSWLYYALLIIFWGKLLGKEIVLSSQTLGPFYGSDVLFAALFLNLPQSIEVREKIDGKFPLHEFGILLPKVTGGRDAAYTLTPATSFTLPAKKADYRIGLSLHSWGNIGPQMQKHMIKLLTDLSHKHTVELVVIPHIITQMMDTQDSVFMKKIVTRLPKTIRVFSLGYKEIMSSAAEPASTIKYLSGAVDLLITSRYHGLIFGLSLSTPCLTFMPDPYYRRKNGNALAFYYAESEWEKYTLEIVGHNVQQKNNEKVQYLLQNNKKEKQKLRSFNKTFV